MLKPLSVWITTNWKSLKEMGIPDHLTCLLRNLYFSGGQEATEPDMEQQTGSKLGKEYVKAVYCHRAYLTYMQSTSCEMPGWMKHKLESGLPGEISINSDMQIKEISPGCSLEGLLKLKLQYFAHLMRRADSFEKTLMLGKIEGRRRRR